eukprot:745877-Hanusia_phi.AAC.2
MSVEIFLSAHNKAEKTTESEIPEVHFILSEDIYSCCSRPSYSRKGPPVSLSMHFRRLDRYCSHGQPLPSLTPENEEKQEGRVQGRAEEGRRCERGVHHRKLTSNC